jgi:hypothetical protein
MIFSHRISTTFNHSNRSTETLSDRCSHKKHSGCTGTKRLKHGQGIIACACDCHKRSEKCILEIKETLIHSVG